MTCHPDSAPGSVERVEASVERRKSGDIWMRFHVDIPLVDLVLAGPAAPERTDGLWQTTCFEAFVRKGEGPEYYEYNFAASSQWAAYRFDHYRKGMADLPMDRPPEIETDAGVSHFAIEVGFKLPDVFADVPLMLNVTAVIEEAGGAKSYWAAKHAPGAPDFHHKDCFAHALEAPGEA